MGLEEVYCIFMFVKAWRGGGVGLGEVDWRVMLPNECSGLGRSSSSRSRESSRSSMRRGPISAIAICHIMSCISLGSWLNWGNVECLFFELLGKIVELGRRERTILDQQVLLSPVRCSLLWAQTL